MKNHPPRAARRQKQRGALLIEALVSMTILAVGVLGLVGLWGQMTKHTTESKYRMAATYLVNQLIGRMWVDQPNLASYSHQPSGAGGNGCTFSGASSSNPNFAQWQALVAAADGLPSGAAATPVQVVVTKDAPQLGNTQVQITLCWRMPQDNNWRKHQVVANINPVN
jgi:type IV pilus assembly protein PilV